MAITYLSPINLGQLELQNAKIQNLGSDPGSPVKGQLWLNSTSNLMKWYDGSANIDPLARANHSGTQNWTTLTGTPTTLGGYGIVLGAISGITTLSMNNQLTNTLAIGTAPFVITSTTRVANLNVAVAGTADALTTGRTINGTTFDGTANVTVTAAAGTLTGTTLNSSVVTSSLTSVGTLASLAVTGNVTAADPTTSSQLTTKSYVDNLITGISWKNPVKAASTANLTLSGTQTVDGVALVATDRVLVKNQSTAANNGIYLVASGSWTRALDADTAAELDGAAVYVLGGTTQADFSYTETAAITTLGSDTVTFVQFAAAQGAAAAGSLTGTTLAANVVNSSLTSVGTLAALTVTATITGSVSGNAATVTTNANLTGDVTSSGNATTLANSGVTASTYKSVTVDAKGRVTGGTNPTTTAGYGITDGPLRYSANIGDGSTTSIVVTHSLGTRNVVLSICSATTPWGAVIADWSATSTNTVTIVFATAPTTNAYNVTILA